MPQLVTMPKLGELTETVVVQSWRCAVGDTVVEGQPLVEVETDKVETEVPAPLSGTVTRLLVAESDEVEVGQPICEIEP